MPLDLQQLLRQAPVRVHDSGAGSTAAAAPVPIGVDKRPLVLQPQLRQAPIGRTECRLVLRGRTSGSTPRQAPRGLTTATGSTAAAAPGPFWGSRQRNLFLGGPIANVSDGSETPGNCSPVPCGGKPRRASPLPQGQVS
jgi:hypothetical protein